jgi:hypothetical protein
MKPIDELVNIILSFTPEQLKLFLNDPVTESILRPVAEQERCLQEVS